MWWSRAEAELAVGFVVHGMDKERERERKRSVIAERVVDCRVLEFKFWEVGTEEGRANGKLLTLGLETLHA